MTYEVVNAIRTADLKRVPQDLKRVPSEFYLTTCSFLDTLDFRVIKYGDYS